MNFLIFLVSIIYSFLFYFFYLASNNRNIFGLNFSSSTYFESFSGNLIIESILFIIIGVLFYLYFSDFSFKNKDNIEDDNILEEAEQKNILNVFKKQLNIVNFKYFIINFFKNYIYYFGFIFLYLGIYFIYKSLNFYEFSYIILFINIIVLILFFITHKFFIFRDFIKINLILFSVYYLVFYFYNFSISNASFLIVDIINSLLVLLNFLLVFYNDNKILKQKKLDNALLLYFFIFIFSFLSFSVWSILDNFIASYSISAILLFIATLISVSSYYIFTKIKFFENNIIILRIISFIFSYFSTLLSFYYFITFGFNIFVFFALVYYMIFFFKTHNKFQNYISFFFSNTIFVFLVYYFYKSFFYSIDDGIIFLVLSLIMSLEGIVLTYFYEFNYEFDYYFFHFYSYIVNFVSIIFYLIVFKIDLFTLGIIFFVESFYIFLSYYRLKQLKNKI